MSRLRLGPVFEDKPVKLTLELPGALGRELAAYAEVHAKSTGLARPLPPEKIAVAMIERFIVTDRGYASLRKRN